MVAPGTAELLNGIEIFKKTMIANLDSSSCSLARFSMEPVSSCQPQDQKIVKVIFQMLTSLDVKVTKKYKWRAIFSNVW